MMYTRFGLLFIYISVKVSGIGKVSQVIFALVMPGGIAANLIAGGIAEAGEDLASDQNRIYLFILIWVYL